MPFGSKTVSPPNHREEMIFAAIDHRFGDLSRTLLAASGSHQEMQTIIEAMASSIAAAKIWIYSHGRA